MNADDNKLPPAAHNPANASTAADTHDNPAHHHDTAPVVIWRTVADRSDATTDNDAGDRRLTVQLARHLVAIYSDVHGIVVDLDADDNLRHAADAAGRRYLPMTAAASLAAVTTDEPGQAALIVLRWPRPAAATRQDAYLLLRACQRQLADDGSTIVAVASAPAGQPGVTYAEHEQLLLPAAHAAGLRHLHDIVPLTAADGRDSFTYATAHDETPAPDRDTGDSAMRQTASITLLIFGHYKRRR